VRGGNRILGGIGRRFRTAVAAAALAVGCWAAGCANVVIAPAPERLDRPRRVFLLDHGYHSSLMLPAGEEGRWEEYAYGEYRWFALSRTNVFRALVVPSQGTLGRAVHRSARPDSLAGTPVAWAEGAYEMRFEADAVEALLAELRAPFADDEAEGRTSPPGRRLTFVKFDRPYSLGWTCNHATAAWLERLGATTRGPGVLSKWSVRVREAEAAETGETSRGLEKAETAKAG
jgi:hypothetical protein